MTLVSKVGKIARTLLLGAVIVVFYSAQQVNAQTVMPKSSALEADPTGWRVRLGAAVLVVPEYLGSEDYEIVGGPNFDIKYSNWFFANPLDGVGVNVYNSNGLKLGGAVSYRFGRDEDDARILNGLGDLDDSAELIAFAKYLWGPVQFSASYKYGVGEDDTGGLFEVGVGSGLPLGEGFILLGKVSAEFMDSDYADAYFSVSAAQSARSGLAIYDAATGWRSVSVSLLGVYDLTDRWAFQAGGKYSYLGAHAHNSPIVQSEDQLYGGFGFTYKLIP